jgi:hypothetical protein
LVSVLNAWRSAFARAGSCDRAMIVMLPVMALLLRAPVVCQRDPRGAAHVGRPEA